MKKAIQFLQFGQTTTGFTLVVNNIDIDGQKLDNAFQGKLEEIYPTEFEQSKELQEVPAVASNVVLKTQEKVEQLINVFNRNTCLWLN